MGCPETCCSAPSTRRGTTDAPASRPWFGSGALPAPRAASPAARPALAAPSPPRGAASAATATSSPCALRRPRPPWFDEPSCRKHPPESKKCSRISALPHPRHRRTSEDSQGRGHAGTARRHADVPAVTLKLDRNARRFVSRRRADNRPLLMMHLRRPRCRVRRGMRATPHSLSFGHSGKAAAPVSRGLSRLPHRQGKQVRRSCRPWKPTAALRAGPCSESRRRRP